MAMLAKVVFKYSTSAIWDEIQHPLELFDLSTYLLVPAKALLSARAESLLLKGIIINEAII